MAYTQNFASARCMYQKLLGGHPIFLSSKKEKPECFMEGIAFEDGKSSDIETTRWGFQTEEKCEPLIQNNAWCVVSRLSYLGNVVYISKLVRKPASGLSHFLVYLCLHPPPSLDCSFILVVAVASSTSFHVQRIPLQLLVLKIGI